ncbi:hypothetical protein NLM27_42410 [Bradyrhizobium sp. CCGB12]|uniref:hypothetical protein n=1 Tax=Bradyrhizobium sp. CCGB12 TaxID=2949632 RepID=UPI0020B428B5|nr:hypothetical protein [Bradyrhizobium sp. CCGB12]MCP3395377.1 hypothetical protein [Bradyrhizobium sp. CCGB12]
MGLKRRRFKQATSLEDRLAQFTDDIRKQAEAMPSGGEKDKLLKKVRSAEEAISLERQLRESH